MPTFTTWMMYRRKGLTEMRPYEAGEDLSGISVSASDTPQVGGWIARNPDDPTDQWYVNQAYFDKHMTPVLES